MPFLNEGPMPRTPITKPETSRPLKPYRRTAGPWRGGQIVAIDPPNATLRLFLEEHLIGTRTIAQTLLPTGSVVGNAIGARLVGTGAADYVVVEVRSTHFIGMQGPIGDQITSVERGEFFAGHCMYWWTTESPYFDWQPDPAA